METYLSTYENTTCVSGSIVLTRYYSEVVDEIMLPMGACDENGHLANNFRPNFEEFKPNAWYMQTTSSNATLFTQTILNDTCVRVDNASVRANCHTNQLTMFQDTKCLNDSSIVHGSCAVIHGQAHALKFLQENCTGLLVEVVYNASRNTSWPTTCQNKQLYVTQANASIFPKNVSYALLSATNLVADSTCIAWNGSYLQTNCSNNITSIYNDANCSELIDQMPLSNCLILNPTTPKLPPKWVSTYLGDNCTGALVSSVLTSDIPANTSCTGNYSSNSSASFIPNASYFSDSNTTTIVLSNHCTLLNRKYGMANCSRGMGSLSFYQDKNCSIPDLEKLVLLGSCSTSNSSTVDLVKPPTPTPKKNQSMIPAFTFLRLIQNSTSLPTSTSSPPVSTTKLVTIRTSTQSGSSSISSFISIAVLSSIVILVSLFFIWKRCKARHSYTSIH